MYTKLMKKLVQMVRNWKKKKNIRRKEEGGKKPAMVMLAVLFGALLVTGCSGDGMPKKPEYFQPQSQNREDADTQDTEEKEDSSYEYALLMSLDMVEETLVVHDYASDRDYTYHFDLSTRFLDKYGDYTSETRFVPGTIVKLGERDGEGTLKSLQLSPDVWVYEDVSNYSYDIQRGIFEIAGENYRMGQQFKVFSDENQTALASIGEKDVLTVIGVDKQVLSVQITTGHGTLHLTNTELFDDSYLQLNKDRFFRIQGEMEIEVPEGTYTMAIANDGWGSTQEITVVRNETLTLDLDSIKGEGPKYGNILFAIDVVGAKLFVDREEIEDYTEPISLKYGAHEISVSMEGLDSWTRTLYVNSPEATIEITLDDGSSSDSDKNTSGNTNGSTSGSTTGGTNNSTSSGTTGGTNNSTSSGTTGDTNNSTGNTTGNNPGSSSGHTTDNSDSLTDYLTTLTNMLTSVAR